MDDRQWARTADLRDGMVVSWQGAVAFVSGSPEPVAGPPLGWRVPTYNLGVITVYEEDVEVVLPPDPGPWRPPRWVAETGWWLLGFVAASLPVIRAVAEVRHR